MTTSRFPSRVPVLPPEIQSRVQTELQPGERLVWADQPDPKLYARGMWAVTIFGVVFTAFSLFWIFTAAGMIWFGGRMAGGSGFFKLAYIVPLFGLPFLAIGIGMLFGPMWGRKAAGQTIYAITDRRAIVWRANSIFSRSIEVRSFSPTELGEISRVERLDGSGDLIFKEYYTVNYDGDGHRYNNRTRQGFIGIFRVREIEDLLRKTLPSP